MNLILEIPFFFLQFSFWWDRVHLANNLIVKCFWPEMSAFEMLIFAQTQTLKISFCVSISMSNIVQMLSDKVSTENQYAFVSRPSESHKIQKN